MATPDTATRTVRRRSDRRQQIIDVATTLFRRNGYHATSLDDIADGIGFTKPAIYYYFESKEDILFEIVDGIVDGALERTTSIAARSDPAADRLHALLVENTRVVLQDLEANSVFYNERGLLSAERESAIRRREREYTRVVYDLFREGVAEGNLVDADATVATATLLGASIWAYRWFDPAGRLDADEVAEEIARLLLDGYRRR